MDGSTEKPTILVIGIHREKYAHLGNIVHRPLIDCIGLEDYSGADSILGKLTEFNWIVFTSANAIRFFFQRLHAIGLDARALCGTQVAVIGKSLADRLAEFGIVADLCADTESSIGLLEKCGDIGVENERILLPQSEIASRELSNGLAQMGAGVERLPIYRTVELDPGQRTSRRTVSVFLHWLKRRSTISTPRFLNNPATSDRARRLVRWN